jgi:phenylacetate-CoA ligase
MIRPAIARYVYTPLYYRVYGRFNHAKYYRFLRRSQWNTLEANRKVQGDLLYDILRYCAKEIPYYQRIVEEQSIDLRRDRIFDALTRFPVLTKDIIRREYDNMHKIRPGIKWYEYSSSGSTGEPITLIQDFEYKMKMLLYKRLQIEWAGVHVGDTSIKLWGSEVEVIKEQDTLQHRFANWVNSIHVLNAFLMDDARMRKYVDIINEVRPKFILAYSNSLSELAEYIDRHRLKVHQPQALMTSAMKLYPPQRKQIEKVFGCRIFDRYGTREVGDIASECEEHSGLHISMFMHYVEILNKEMQPCREGESGEVFVTLLTNYTMPLIRYRIGDTGIATHKACPCGRGIPLIKDVVGREIENFVRPDGKVVSGTRLLYFLGIADKKKPFDKFQAIQKSPDHIEVRVVVRDRKAFEEDRECLEEPIRKAMGECRITWRFVKDIKPTRSGKYRHMIRGF